MNEYIDPIATTVSVLAGMILIGFIVFQCSESNGRSSHQTRCANACEDAGADFLNSTFEECRCQPR